MNNLHLQPKNTSVEITKSLPVSETTVDEKILIQIKAASITQLKAKLAKLDKRLNFLENDSIEQGDDVGKNSEYNKLIEITGLLQDELALKQEQFEVGFGPVNEMIDMIWAKETLKSKMNNLPLN